MENVNLNWVKELQNIILKKVYSQMGEESVIEHIFNNIGVTNRYFVDFGAWDGSFLSNTKLLKEKGWNGLMMDGDNRGNAEVKQEFITAENIEELFKKYDVPKQIDLLCIDIDGNDWYVWDAIKNYDARVVLIEFNGCIDGGESKTIKYNPAHTWGNNDYYGASFMALKKLGALKGYSLVMNLLQTNLFFIKDELLGGHQEFGIIHTKNQYHAHSPNREWVNV